MEPEIYTVSQFAKAVGVSVRTLQRWDRDGTFKPAWRLPNGDRRYTGAQLLSFSGAQEDGPRGMCRDDFEDTLLWMVLSLQARPAPAREGDYLRAHRMDPGSASLFDLAVCRMSDELRQKGDPRDAGALKREMMKNLYEMVLPLSGDTCFSRFSTDMYQEALCALVS